MVLIILAAASSFSGIAAYNECLHKEVARLEPSGESAGTIASVAVSRCEAFTFLASGELRGLRPSLMELPMAAADKEVRQSGRIEAMDAVMSIRAARGQ